MASTSTSRPASTQPRRRQRVRLVLGRRAVRPVRARPAADRVQLVEPLEDPHARSLVPAQRPQKPPRRRAARAAATTNADGHDVADDDRARRPPARRRPPPRARSAGRRSPLRSARGPASSAAAVNDEPVPRHRQPAREDRRHEQPDRPARERRRQSRTTDDREPDAEQRHDTRADDVRPAPAADAEHRREHLRRRRTTSAARLLGEAVLVVRGRATPNPITAICA